MKSHFFLVALLLFPASLASAQGDPGPFGGLFGRTPNRSGVNSTVFDVRGSGGVQWGDSVFEDTNLPGQTAGAGGNAAAGASFARNTDRFNMQAGTNVDYSQTLTGPIVGGTSADGGLRLSGRLTTRWTADAGVNYRYSPYFQYHPSFVWLDSGLVVPGLPYVATAVDNHSVQSTASTSFQYGKSSTLSASASRNTTWFPGRPDSDITSTGFHGTWLRRLTRDLGLRLGYGRTRVHQQLSTSPTMIHEEIDCGIDFNKALSLSQRTTMAFSTAMSVLRPTGGEARYRLNGSVVLSRLFGRTWSASFNANRGTEFVPGLVEPVFSDSLGLSVGGLLARRVEWTTSLNGTRGEVGFDKAYGTFVAAGASTNVNFALTRHLGVYAQYGLYHHRVPPRASSIPTVARFSRQSASVGISMWIPVYARERTAE